MNLETKLFNKMIEHYIKSVSKDKGATAESRKYHEEMYVATKHLLWKMEEDKDVKLD